MLDFLQLLADILFKALPSISEARRKRDIRDLGAKLFVLYLRLADCAGTAEDVVNALEAYSLHQNEGTRNGLRTYLQKQAVNIRYLFTAFEQLGWAIRMLDPSISSDLRLFLGGKEQSIGLLAATMARGNLKLDLSGRIMHELQQHIEMQTESTDFEQHILAINLNMAVMHAPTIRTDPLSSESAEAIAEEAEGRLSIIRGYIRSGKPQQQVRDINGIVEKLHGILATNFSVVEIMPTVKQLLSRQS